MQTNLNERVVKLEVTLEGLTTRLDKLERRLWFLGFLIIGASNGVDLVKIWAF